MKKGTADNVHSQYRIYTYTVLVFLALWHGRADFVHARRDCKHAVHIPSCQKLIECYKVPVEALHSGTDKRTGPSWDATSLGLLNQTFPSHAFCSMLKYKSTQWMWKHVLSASFCFLHAGCSPWRSAPLQALIQFITLLCHSVNNTEMSNAYFHFQHSWTLQRSASFFLLTNLVPGEALLAKWSGRECNTCIYYPGARNNDPKLY